MAYNKARVAIDDADKELRKLANNSITTLHWIDRWDGLLGKVTKSHLKTPVDDTGVLAIVGGFASVGSPRVLTWADAKAMATKIDSLYVGADHLLIKNNVNWQRMYQHAVRAVPYMDATGAVANRHEATIPCHNCGVMLPFGFLQVDHHQPQSDVDGLHILKTLRVLGGTTAASTGTKGQAYVGGTLNAVNAFPKARDRTYNHLVNATAANKWATNDKGSAFISLMDAMGALADLRRMCMNNLLNLAPLCPECNVTKSNWVKPIA